MLVVLVARYLEEGEGLVSSSGGDGGSSSSSSSSKKFP